MTEASFEVEDYRIGLHYDWSLGLFVGSVLNKPYRVRLHADAEATLRAKVDRLLTVYLGAHRSDRQAAAPAAGPPLAVGRSEAA